MADALIYFVALIFTVFAVIGFLFGDSSDNSCSSHEFDGFDVENHAAGSSDTNDNDREALETWYWQGHK